MALVKPIAQAEKSFDAENQHTFYFKVNGGDQVVGNILTIRTQWNNAIVYQDRRYTYAFSHTVPLKILHNNESYVYSFQTFDAKGNVSEESNSIYLNV